MKKVKKKDTEITKSEPENVNHDMSSNKQKK